MPPLQGVGTGQIQGNHFQGIQNEPGGLNGQGVRAGAGRDVRRAFQEGLSDIKSFFKGIGDRIKAHHQHNVEKARTSIANRGAQKAVEGLTGTPVSERKVLSGLSTVMEKAMKLDPEHPLEKAVEIIGGKLGGLSSDEKLPLYTANFSQMKNLLSAMGQRARQEGFAVATALHDSGMMGGEVPQAPTGPSPKEVLTGRLLDHLSGLGAQHFAHDLNGINTQLTEYFGDGGINAQTMFRQNAEVTKTMGTHLAKVNAPALEGIKQQTVSQAKQTSKEIGNLEIGSFTKANLESLTPEQFNGILAGTAEILESMMGGATEEGARLAAGNLSPHVVRVLQATDQQVVEHLAGDATARETAFVGTLFLRSLTPPLATAHTGQPEQTAAVIKLFSQIATFTLNQATELEGKMSGLSGANYESLTQFIAAYAAPLTAFREAVLARTDV